MKEKQVLLLSRDLSRIVLPGCLFISGASALALEVVWAKYLTVLVGSTALAHTVVLSTFMGGLAGGAWFFGRYADRLSRPLILYAALEMGVAISSILFPLAMVLAGAIYVKTAAPFAESTPILVAMRAGLAVATILIPSLLMGGTLPAVTRHYVRSISEVGSGVGRLYFINALGAVLGCLAAGFILIPRTGLDITLFIAASLNIIASLAALMLVAGKRWNTVSTEKKLTGEAERDSPEDKKNATANGQETENSSFPSWVAGLALAAIAVSGAASMTYEIVWIRILTLVMGGSTYAFTTMLAAFILGIAIGSALVSWKKTGLSQIGLAGFGYLQVMVAAVTVFSIPLYNRLPYLYHRAGRLLLPEAENYPLFLCVGFLVCLMIMIIPTIILGMTFPVAARLATRSIRSLGGGVGKTYASDTAGTVAGVILAAHVFLPVSGIQGAIVIAALLNLGAGMICLLSAWIRSRPPKPMERRWRFAVLAFSVGILPIWMFSGPQVDRFIFNYGVFRFLGKSYDSYPHMLGWASVNRKVLFDRDGENGTVSVMDFPLTRSMKVNGKTDASDGSDLETQYLAAHLPVMLHPSPQSAMVVGLGAGATSAGLLAHEDLRVVTVELSRDVVEAARFFEHVNRGAMDHPRMQMIVDDVQAWLALSDDSFDIVVSVPSNPWVSGNASLFTSDFFELVKNHMNPGGIMLQWFHDYEMTEEAVRTILRTVGRSFDHVHLFHAGSIRDYLLVCSMSPIRPDPLRIDRIIEDNRLVREDLDYARIRTHLGIYARHLLDTEGIIRAGGDGLSHSRKRPLLEYQAPRGLFIREDIKLLRNLDSRKDPENRSRVLLSGILERAESLTEDEWVEILDATGYPFENIRTALARRWADTGSMEGYRSLAHTLYNRRHFGEAIEVFRKIKESELTGEDIFYLKLTEAIVAGIDGPVFYPGGMNMLLQEVYEAASEWNDMKAYDLTAAHAYQAGYYEIAEKALKSALMLPPDSERPRADYLLKLVDIQVKLNKIEEARHSLSEAIIYDPENLRTLSIDARMKQLE